MIGEVDFEKCVCIVGSFAAVHAEDKYDIANDECVPQEMENRGENLPV